MADYRLASGGMVWKNPHGPLMTLNGDDPDYQVFLAWLGAGNTPDPDPATLLPHDLTYADDPFLPLQSE
jgi:hypothetical protein